MLRALFSAVTLLLLSLMAFLLYSNYFAAGVAAPPIPKSAPAKAPLPLPIPPARPVAAPTPAPAPVPTPLPERAPAPAIPSPPVADGVPKPAPEPKALKRTHVVAAGESLSIISQKYYGTPELHGKIAEANNLRGKDRIRAGQVLVIPDLPRQAPPAETAAAQDFEPIPPTLSVKRPRESE